MLEWCNSVLTKIEKFGLVLACTASFMIMAIVSVDVACRYLLGAPLGWAFEVISLYLTVSLFFLAMPAAFAGNHNVRVDVLVRNASPHVKDAISIISLSLTAVLFGALLVTAAKYAWVDWSEGAAISGEIPWPTWIPPAIVTLGAVMLLVRLLWCFLSAIASIFNPGSAASANDDGRTPF